MLIGEGAPPTRKLGCGFLPPKDGVDLHHVALPFQGIEVVRHSHQVGLGGQTVFRVSVVTARENAQLACFNERPAAFFLVSEK